MTVLAALLAGLSWPALAASPNLVISQVYGAGGNTGTTIYKNDYVEIFNRGATAVTLSGWSLQYASASNSTWSGKAILPTMTVEPGQYVLVQQQGGGGTSQPALPTPVVVPLSGAFNMAAANGKLALVNDSVTINGHSPATPNVVDMIGFGSASGAEGTAAPSGSNTLALFRAEGGCVDTDANDLDITTGAPAPRTSDSARNLCGGGNVAQPIIPACPESLSVEQGSGGMAALSATDADSVVNSADITSGGVPGITLAGFAAAGAEGGVASVTLQADASLGVGSYPVVISFGNNAGQQASCTVNVSVSGAATIPQIQGEGATSPFNNLTVTTEGVVTHKVANGFFLQDPTGDGNPATSDGLFVFAPTAVNVGDRMRVSGTITEYRPSGAPRTYTEMKDVTASAVLSTGNSVTPTNITFDGTLDLARLEAMLVNVVNPLVVNQTSYLGNRGELTLADGRRETATNRFRPNTPEAIALAAANAKNQLVLDDSLFSTPTVIPYIDGGSRVVRAGDTVTGLTGVIDYGSIGGGGGGFKLQYSVEPSFTASNPRTAAPQLAAGNLRVASANVLNYFTTFTNGADVFGNVDQGCTLGNSIRRSNCRGADNQAEFDRQNAKIVNELKALDADVLGLMEIQNNGDVAVDYLVRQLNAAIGFPTYTYVPAPPATGTDAIRVTMIYKPAKVSLVGSALSDSDDVNSRPPMAQTFKTANGAKFSLVVNHLKAKSGCGSGANGDLGDGQGCHNLRRTEQAARLRDYFLPLVASTAGDPDLLVIGDMNAHGFEDPIHLLTQAGLVNQLERFVRPSGIPYSYVFDGEVGYLDHALASASLNAQIVGATEWHINADEPAMIDYNLDGKSPAALALIEDHAYRSADHDPVVVSLNLAPAYADVTGGFAIQRSALALNRLTGKFSGTITLTNTTSAAISGPFQVQLKDLPAGITLDNATGSKDGAPYITVNNASVAPGAKFTVSLVFSNPRKVPMSYTHTIYSGTF
ncbi:ExeM/NucH family extracellular endonuclease [Massilia sp. PAMC28688]|nr:ExeM/NucH family extracellular endonuclease [Massilia sp. PAMC28688]